MALPGEIQGTKGTTCPECGKSLELDVYKSAAGYYLGYFCPCSGPISRESGYFRSEEMAKAALEKVKKGEGEKFLRGVVYKL